MADKRSKTLTDETIERKLTTFNNSQDSVQATSAWIMVNKVHHQRIVDGWLKVLKNSESKHKLTLFYLCNDVVQHAKRKKALYYLENFKDNLREAVHLVRDLNKIKPNIGRIFKIWEERRTYDAKFLAELRRILENEAGGTSSLNSSASVTPMSPVDTPPTPVKSRSERSHKRSKDSDRSSSGHKRSKAVDGSHKHRGHDKDSSLKRRGQDKDKHWEDTIEKTDRHDHKEEEAIVEDEDDNLNILIKFKPAKFVDQMTSLRKLETEVGQKTKQLTTLRIDATNIEAVKQLKDRSHGQEFCKQFEDSCVKIEDYVDMLEKEIRHRKQVVTMGNDAETFYDEQFKEAKIVANAYKNFGARITNMKKRVDDMKKIIPATPSPVPSPSPNAPSPGNTPPLQDMDDNENVDMEICDGEAESNKAARDAEAAGESGRAYTAMVKSVTQPIASLTNITMGDETEPAPYNPASPARSPSPPSTFQGSNILESRIATMLPNLAKGNSNIGLQGPKSPAKVIEDYVPPKSDDYVPPISADYVPPKSADYVPPKPARKEPVKPQTPPPQEEPADDRSSTPVLDEQEDKTPTPVKTPPVSKTPPAKVKTNPIDFLSQLLTKSSNASSSSNFLHSLSLLTNTVKSHYQKKQQEDGPKSPDTVASVAPTESIATFSAVPPPQPTTQTSTWSAWKTVTTPTQPPLPQQPEPPSLPVLPAPPQAPPPDLPPLPQHQPPPPEPSSQAPLPTQPYPVQPPSPQGFPPSQPFPPTNPPTPVSQPAYLAQGSVSQPYGQIRPLSGPSVNSQAFSAQTATTSAIGGTANMGFQPRFPFGVAPNGDPSLPTVQPPLPSDTLDPSAPQPPASFIPGAAGRWEQPRSIASDVAPPSRVQPVIQGSYAPPPPPPPPDNAPPPAWQNDPPPPPPQPSTPNYGNRISAVPSMRSSWNRSSSWEGREDAGEAGGYVHPWNQPQDYDDEDDEEADMIDDLPCDPLPPAPKSILRNRASSLREVTLVDENDSAAEQNFSTPHSAPVSDHKPIGILRKPPIENRSSDPIADVQTEFIAKLKQKSGGASATPLPSNRNLTTISMLDSVDEHSDTSAPTSKQILNQGEPISTIGVLRGTGRASSIKSDDMDIDDDEEMEDVSNGTNWQGTDTEMWQEERQGLMPASSTAYDRLAPTQHHKMAPISPISPEPIRMPQQQQHRQQQQQPFQQQSQQQRPPLLNSPRPQQQLRPQQPLLNLPRPQQQQQQLGPRQPLLNSPRPQQQQLGPQQPLLNLPRQQLQQRPQLLSSPRPQIQQQRPGAQRPQFTGPIQYKSAAADWNSKPKSAPVNHHNFGSRPARMPYYRY